MAGRDATFVLCPFSFQPCVGPYVGRARTSDQFGAIACMRSRTPSATSFFTVYRRGGSRLLFFHSAKWHETFSARWHHQPQRPRQFAYFSDTRCIFYGFPGQKSIKHWPDVTQRSFCIRFHSNLAWGPTLAVPTCTHTLVHLHACDHVAQCNQLLFGLPERGSQLRFFFYSVKRHVTFSTRWHHHPQRPHQFAYFSDARCIFYGFPGQK